MPQWLPSQTRHLQRSDEPTSTTEHRVKCWCFTINNQTPEGFDKICDVLTEDNCEFAVVRNEIGENGTRHLQGFVNMRTKHRMSMMKRWLSPRGHYKAALGSDLQNDKYCFKGGDIYLRIGTSSVKCARNDWKRAIESVKTTSRNLKAIAKACLSAFIRNGHGLRDYINVMQFRKPCDFKTSVMVLVGSPGCGKSTTCAAVAHTSEICQEKLFFLL